MAYGGGGGEDKDLRNLNLKSKVLKCYLTTMSVIKITRHQLQMDARVWSIGGMIMTDEDRSTGRKTVPVSLLPPQIPDGLALN
jgi:hypothetical protein